MLGKPYQITFSKLLAKDNAPAAAPAPEDFGGGGPSSLIDETGLYDDLNQRGFFCSELVATAYKALGVLPPERPASGYWPVTFGERASAQLTLLHGARFGEEVPVEFETPAVGDTLTRTRSGLWKHY